MLLASERHTPADLAFWAKMQRGDRLNGERLQRSAKARSAVAAVRKFADAGPCYVGTSWGKDSVVVCHLAALSGARVPFVHIVQEGPQKDPEQHRVRNAFFSRFDVEYHEVVVEPQTVAQIDGKHAPALDVGIGRVREAFGARWVSGLRAAESGVRKLRAKIGSVNSCWPIAWWSTEDVYAWLEVHELPVHPAYACTQGGLWDRDWIRVSILGGEKGTQHGRREWERHYYPAEMAAIEAWKEAL